MNVFEETDPITWQLAIDFPSMSDEVHRDYSILSIRFVNHSIISYSQFTQAGERTHKALRPYSVKVLRQPTELGDDSLRDCFLYAS